MRHHHPRHVDRQIAVAELVEVQHVRAQFANQRRQEATRFVQVVFRLLHPLQTESRGPVFEAVQMIHPHCLLRQRNLAETDERDSYPARDQTGHEFAAVGP